MAHNGSNIASNLSWLTPAHLPANAALLTRTNRVPVQPNSEIFLLKSGSCSYAKKGSRSAHFYTVLAGNPEERLVTVPMLQRPSPAAGFGQAQTVPLRRKDAPELSKRLVRKDLKCRFWIDLA
jgi:hypothetical protein